MASVALSCAVARPGSRIGTSYSLFLIHFPVFLVVASVWIRLEWDSPSLTLFGLGIAFVASLAAAAVFHRLVEASAARWSRSFT